MMQRSLIAIVLSIASISILLKINSMIAHIYEMSGQRTRSVFGIIELGFLYKYYTGVLGLMAIVLAIMALRKSEEKRWVIAAFTISICAFLATFVKLWKFMV